jgi:hypothetical protein
MEMVIGCDSVSFPKPFDLFQNLTRINSLVKDDHYDLCQA